MRAISETDVENLRRENKIRTKTGERVRQARPVVKKTSVEERQVLAIESLSETIAVSIKATNDNAIATNKTTTILSEHINRIKPQPCITLPKPIKEWRFKVTRDSDGFIEAITAKAEGPA